MKFRQAKKVIKSRFNGCLIVGDPTLRKAIPVYVKHMKKAYRSFYEKRGIITLLRKIYG